MKTRIHKHKPKRQSRRHKGGNGREETVIENQKKELDETYDNAIKQVKKLLHESNKSSDPNVLSDLFDSNETRANFIDIDTIGNGITHLKKFANIFEKLHQTDIYNHYERHKYFYTLHHSYSELYKKTKKYPYEEFIKMFKNVIIPHKIFFIQDIIKDDQMGNFMAFMEDKIYQFKKGTEKEQETYAYFIACSCILSPIFREILSPPSNKGNENNIINKWFSNHSNVFSDSNKSILYSKYSDFLDTEGYINIDCVRKRKNAIIYKLTSLVSKNHIVNDISYKIFKNEMNFFDCCPKGENTIPSIIQELLKKVIVLEKKDKGAKKERNKIKKEIASSEFGELIELKYNLNNDENNTNTNTIDYIEDKIENAGITENKYALEYLTQRIKNFSINKKAIDTSNDTSFVSEAMVNENELITKKTVDEILAYIKNPDSKGGTKGNMIQGGMNFGKALLGNKSINEKDNESTKLLQHIKNYVNDYPEYTYTQFLTNKTKTVGNFTENVVDDIFKSYEFERTELKQSVDQTKMSNLQVKIMDIIEKDYKQLGKAEGDNKAEADPNPNNNAELKIKIMDFWQQVYNDQTEDSRGKKLENTKNDIRIVIDFLSDRVKIRKKLTKKFPNNEYQDNKKYKESYHEFNRKNAIKYLHKLNADNVDYDFHVQSMIEDFVPNLDNIQGYAPQKEIIDTTTELTTTFHPFPKTPEEIPVGETPTQRKIREEKWRSNLVYGNKETRIKKTATNGSLMASDALGIETIFNFLRYTGANFDYLDMLEPKEEKDKDTIKDIQKDKFTLEEKRDRMIMVPKGKGKEKGKEEDDVASIANTASSTVSRMSLLVPTKVKDYVENKTIQRDNNAKNEAAYIKNKDVPVGFKLMRSPPDGKCLYHSILMASKDAGIEPGSTILSDKEKSDIYDVMTLKESLLDYLLSHNLKQDIKSIYFDTETETELNEIGLEVYYGLFYSHIWGGDAEINLTAALYNITIITYSVYDRKFLGLSPKGNGGTIYLIWYGSHYDWLKPLNTDDNSVYGSIDSSDSVGSHSMNSFLSPGSQYDTNSTDFNVHPKQENKWQFFTNFMPKKR